jgi:hypothetical protein
MENKILDSVDVERARIVAIIKEKWSNKAIAEKQRLAEKHKPKKK